MPQTKQLSTRLEASHALEEWLKRGGPSPVQLPRAKDLPPLLHLNPSFRVVGTPGNLSVICKKAAPAGSVALGVAMHSVLHPRSQAIPEERRKAAACIAAAIRNLRVGAEGLLGAADDSSRIDLIVIVALELLAGKASAWYPYMASLPQLEDAAPPSLWRYMKPKQAEASAVLQYSSMAPKLACDYVELEALFGDPLDKQQCAGFPNEEAADYASGTAILRDIANAARATESSNQQDLDISEAREALLRAIGLVSTRLFAGIGMVPLLDLANGAPGSGSIMVDKPMHNATIERTQLAASNEATLTEPCVALVTSRSMAAGEELILAYGKLSAAEFLYKYGWVLGGPSKAASAASPFNTSVVLRPPGLWSGLTDSQRAVLAKYGLTAGKLGLDETKPWQPSANLEIAIDQAGQGKTTPTMRQLALIACIEDESTLAEVAKTGKLKCAGVEPSEISQRIALWALANVSALAVDCKGSYSSECTWRACLAMRVAYTERAALMKWAAAIREKLGADKASDELERAFEAAEKAHKAATKHLKATVKEVASTPCA